jgi:hypothetical protein
MTYAEVLEILRSQGVDVEHESIRQVMYTLVRLAVEAYDRGFNDAAYDAAPINGRAND